MQPVAAAVTRRTRRRLFAWEQSLGSAVVVACALLSLGSGCDSTAPSPVASPVASPTSIPGYGRPNATAFENLAMVRAAEVATGRRTILVAIGGYVTVSGRLAPGNGWGYVFSKPDDPSFHVYIWKVDDTGLFYFLGEDDRNFERQEVGTSSQIDSTEALRRGAGHATAFLNRFPNSVVRSDLTYLAGLPVWRLEFLDDSPDLSCSWYLYIKGDDGTLLASDRPSCF